MSLEEKISKLLVEQKNIARTLETIYNEVITLQSSLDERRRALEFLKRFGDTESDMEVLFPLGGGFYVNGVIPKADKIFANVGANVYTRKSVDGAIAELEKIIETLTNAISERQKAIEQLRGRYDEINAELSELYFKLQGKTK